MARQYTALPNKIEVAPTTEIHKLLDCTMNLAKLFLNNTKTVSDELVKMGLSSTDKFTNSVCCKYGESRRPT